MQCPKIHEPLNSHMTIHRKNIILRCLSFKCPRCAASGYLKSWFRIKSQCESCGLILARDESGFYFGTTSIGYVISFLFIIIPACVAVILDLVGVWVAVVSAICLSILVNILIFPVLLSWVIMSYFFLQPEALEDTDQKED